MNDIDRTTLKLIEEISKDRTIVIKDNVVKAWNEYNSLFPDLSISMRHLQITLLNINKDPILFGQIMENLRWSIKT